MTLIGRLRLILASPTVACSIGWVTLMVVTVLPRGYAIVSAPAVVDADEAVIALMAKRIAGGVDLPVFHYGQAYLGSLDAFAAAALVALTGSHTAWVLRLVPVFLSCALVVTTFWLGRLSGGVRVGALAAVWLALGPGLVMIWGAKLHLGYLDIAILGGLLYILFLAGLLPGGANATTRSAFVAGGISGLGLWCHPLFIVYVFTVSVFLMADLGRRWPSRRHLLAGFGGLSVGALPLIVYNAVLGWPTWRFLSHGVSPGDWAVDLGSRLYNLIVVMMPIVSGAALPWQIFRPQLATMLPAPLARVVITGAITILAAVATACAALVWARRGYHEKRVRRWFGAAAVVFVACAALLTSLLAAVDPAQLPTDSNPRVAFLSWGTIIQEIANPALAAASLVLLPLLFVAGLIAAGAASDDRRLPRHAERTPAQSGSAERRVVRLLLLHCALVVLAYVGTSWGFFRSPRHLFPLYTAIPVLVGITAAVVARRSRLIAASWYCSIIALNLGVWFAAPPEKALQPVHLADVVDVPRSYEPLVAVLDVLGVDRVYGSYWTVFPLMLASSERILVSTAGSGRLPWVDAEVARAPADVLAFVFYRDKLDGRQFRNLLATGEISHSTIPCGPFDVYVGIDAESLRASATWGQVVACLSHP